MHDEWLLGEWKQIMTVCVGSWSGVFGLQPNLAERARGDDGLDEDEVLDHRVEVETETL